MQMEKPLEFRDSSYRDLLAFPPDVIQEAGYQLGFLQLGQRARDWKPMPSIGPGVEEIRLHEAGGAFRVIYVAKFREAIFVLHCFQKKTQKTASPDIELATKRYRQLVKELDNGQ